MDAARCASAAPRSAADGGASGWTSRMVDFRAHGRSTRRWSRRCARRRACRGHWRHGHRVSGAGHDAVYVARASAPAAMIFVPCEDGYLATTRSRTRGPTIWRPAANVLLHADAPARAGVA
jgi:hypothetical protein